MKGIAKDICPKCKHCEGLDRFRTMYSCKHYNKYPDSAIGIDSEIDCCNFEEVNMNKVEGKVADFCPKCKNCKGVSRESNGVHVWLTEVECEDPYDGMTKILDADSDICCSRFDGTYCHSPNGIFVTSYMALFGGSGDCPSYEEKNEKEEPCDKISLLQHELEMGKLRMKIHQLEKEKSDHLKGIERLKKSQEKLQNQVNNLQATNEESYKREEKLEDKCRKLERRFLDESKRRALDNEFLMSLAHVLYPDEKILKSQGEILKDIKLFKLAYYNLKDDIECYRKNNDSLKTINKGLAEDRKKLINYIRSLKIASENYLKEFTYEED